MPAEWEPQEAIWFTWPPNQRIWAGKGGLIEAKFAEIIALASQFQPVRVNAAAPMQPAVLAALERARADVQAVTLYDHAADDVWCRDHGPLFLRNDQSGELVVTDWVFDGWGGKFSPCAHDTKIPVHIAGALGLPCFSYPEVLEGGALETDGQGLLMTTTAVLLNDNRGGRSKHFWRDMLAQILGIREIIWLGDGLPDDDTDGHIDNLARFLPDGGVLCVSPGDNPALRENRNILEARFPDRVRELPLPVTSGPPMSYANYVVINGAVLMPTFAQARLDTHAAGILGECFPGRTVHPVDCRILLEEGGALHCLSMNEPARTPTASPTTGQPEATYPASG